MQRSNALNRLPRLSVINRLTCLLVLLPALTTTRMIGQELAMISYDQSTAQTAAATGNDPATAPLTNLPAPSLQYQMVGSSLKPGNHTGFSSDLNFDRQTGFNLRDWSRIVYRKSIEDGQSWVWTHVEARYGQLCQLESNLAENALEREQPRYAYLVAYFNF